MVWPPFWRLSWTTASYRPSPIPLPIGIIRDYIPTPQGKLELLSAIPLSDPSRPHILFLHGGFGSAAVWLPFLDYLSKNHGIQCHALSLRGHGSSWEMGYVQLVFRTGLDVLTEDVGAALKWLKNSYGDGENGLEVVLVGHSSGGGLAQRVVERDEKHGVKIRGMGLLAGTPCFGQLGVYWNWFRYDPIFPLRLLFHLYHPLSPLSTLSLIKGAFFSTSVPLSRVEEFRRTCMTGYESLIWPSEMMRCIVDPKKVLANLSEGARGGQRVLVVAGRKDKLMGTKLMSKMAEEYRDAWREMGLGEGEGRVDRGVRYVELDAAHHMQNDIGWETGAERLAEFWAPL